MDVEAVLAITLIFGFIPLLAFAFVVVLLFLGRGRPRRERGRAMDEARWMQEMNDGLMKMTRRVEALETLLMEQKAPPRGERQNAANLEE